jgi:rhamnose transport system ATP-binding protein
MHEKTNALLASLDIHDLRADRVVGSLSVGNRQRVEILRALSQDARILIMDEPTAALTEYDVTRLFDIVRKLKARGVAVIYISHRLDEIFAIADRVTVLRDGAHVATRHVTDTDAAGLVQLMVGRRIDSLFAASWRKPFSASRRLIAAKSGSPGSRSTFARRPRRALWASPTFLRIAARKAWCGR